MKLKEYYKQNCVEELQKQFNYGNVHEIPKVVKIVVNRGLGEVAKNSKAMEISIKEFETVTGQKPIVTFAKKSVAGFKLREGMPIGLKVTLRSALMFNFLEKLNKLVFPRIRDFQGINTNIFDGNGNATIGLKDQLVFPEIEYDTVDQLRGFDVTIVTTAKNDQEGLALLKSLGVPFK
jgi:large subunit ribosomal protein L5